MKITIRTVPALSGTAFLALSLLSGAAFADCTRHIYNKSANVWSYGFTASEDEELDDKALVIVNGETAKIEYVTGDSAPKWLRLEKVTYTDGKPHYKESFAVNGCYLVHDGVTGRAVLNDPADGDVIFID
ncbi:hypothetical protein [Ascidiaceihabitans sp.]|uniref:hypothetical protein n=1 Tax=Ascidiaceihabitans sp. TaxID=1872644 RepID=UPI0032987281